MSANPRLGVFREDLVFWRGRHVIQFLPLQSRSVPCKDRDLLLVLPSFLRDPILRDQPFASLLPPAPHNVQDPVDFNSPRLFHTFCCSCRSLLSIPQLSLPPFDLAHIKMPPPSRHHQYVSSFVSCTPLSRTLFLRTPPKPQICCRNLRRIAIIRRASLGATSMDSIHSPLSPSANSSENPPVGADDTPNDSTGASEALDSATLPPPPVPDTPMDYSLGERTAIVTVPDEESAPGTDVTWLDSILACRGTLSDGNPLSALRAQANKDVTKLKVPTRKMEPWRFTDLRSLYKSRYVGIEPGADKANIFNVREYVGDSAGVVLVFADGVFHEGLSLLDDDSAMAWRKAGGYFGSVEGYKGDDEELRRLFVEAELGTGAEGGLFPSLAHAIGTDAAVIQIPEGFTVSKPVAVLFIGTTGESPLRASASAARVAVLAESGSKITLMESHVSLEKEYLYHLTLGMTAARVGENSSVVHYVMNDVCLEAHLLAHIRAEVHENGRYECRSVGLGANVGRFSVGVDLIGSGSHGTVMGSLISDGYQVLDIHSRICHNAADTTSEQLQKNIASDHARSIFKGKIIVTENGSGTDSSQLCRSILLSDKATVDAMPVLEIATDDVKCSHGATVSDLDSDQLIYCQCRGLSSEQAQMLLIVGFALDVIGDCPFPNTRKKIRQKASALAEKVEPREPNRVDFSSI